MNKHLEEGLERLSKMSRSDFRVRNMYRTKSLFKDIYIPATKTDIEPMFYLTKVESDENYISLYELYMHYADPTEYKFAVGVFKDIATWKKLAETTWFKPYIMEWRQHLQVKLRSEAAEALKQIVDNPLYKETTRLQAAKFLVEKAWDMEGIGSMPDSRRNIASNGSGRKQNDQAHQENKEESKEFLADEARILHLIKG